jgi:hypothetical protein
MENFGFIAEDGYRFYPQQELTAIEAQIKSQNPKAKLRLCQKPEVYRTTERFSRVFVPQWQAYQNGIGPAIPTP